MDYIRNFLCNEPRGHSGMYGAILTEPVNKDANSGVIFFSTVGYDDMCGHGTIGVANILIGTGMVPLEEPSTKVTLETPAGLIKVNQHTIGLELHVPFGGYKKSSSSTFKEQGETALDIFTKIKTVYLSPRLPP